jgi:hypothetical protein
MKCFKCTAEYKRMVHTGKDDILNKLKKEIEPVLNKNSKYESSCIQHVDGRKSSGFQKTVKKLHIAWTKEPVMRQVNGWGRKWPTNSHTPWPLDDDDDDVCYYC